MAERNSTGPRRRPVDVLFGEDIKPAASHAQPLSPGEKSEGVRATPNYMVEPPRPPTILRPPPPEFPPDWRMVNSSVEAPPSPRPRSESAREEKILPAVEMNVVAPPPPTDVAPAKPLLPVSQAIAAQPEPAPVEDEMLRRVATVPAPEQAQLSEEYESLATLIDNLYQQVSDEASDSPTLSEECLDQLHAARSALDRDDLAQAEYCAERVKARLLRARASSAAADSVGVKLIWVWQIFAGLFAVVAILLPLFVALVPGFVPLLRAVSLGALGGVMVSLWNLTHYLHRRDYDPAYNADYLAGPIKGALVGGLIFFLSVLGIVAAPGALGASRLFGSVSGANLLMYFLALLAGIAQDYIFETVRRILAAIFRSPRRARATSSTREVA